MGLIDLATLLDLVDFYGFHVGKYTIPMDLMGPWNSLTANVPEFFFRALEMILFEPTIHFQGRKCEFQGVYTLQGTITYCWWFRNPASR